MKRLNQKNRAVRVYITLTCCRVWLPLVKTALVPSSLRVCITDIELAPFMIEDKVLEGGGKALAVLRTGQHKCSKGCSSHYSTQLSTVRRPFLCSKQLPSSALMVRLETFPLDRNSRVLRVGYPDVYVTNNIHSLSRA